MQFKRSLFVMVNINNKSWDKLRLVDVQKLLSSSDDESFFFEFKSDEESPSKLVKEVSALSNTYGGYIFIGVDDDKKISGCKKWTEQRIHTTIHDSISPVPNFDVKKFIYNGLVVLIIKVEEGSMTPYVTNSGKIYERVSSGSFPIIESGKLTLLFQKRKDQLAQTKEKIELPDIRIDSTCPNNLCGYLDLGFSVVNSEIPSFQRNFFVFDYTEIADYLRSNYDSFSISRLGDSVLISINKVSCLRNDKDRILLNNGIGNFLEIMYDGSVRSRIILTSYPNDERADITLSLTSRTTFEDVYKMIFGKSFTKHFIYALKYEKLTVLKQFSPFFNFPSNSDNGKMKALASYLAAHQSKYGNNLIIEGNRVPKNEFFTIDKRWLTSRKTKFNTDNLVSELFAYEHMNLGFIDPLYKIFGSDPID
jgi:hypothetical protein